eukprot:EG_transcript_45787
MFAQGRWLGCPRGVVQRLGHKFGLIAFEEGGVARTALLTGDIPELKGRDVHFRLKKLKGSGKLTPIDVKLCSAAEATGQIRWFNPLISFGFLRAKDGQEFPLVPMNMQDASFERFLIRPQLQEEVQFDVEEGERGPLA